MALISILWGLLVAVKKVILILDGIVAKKFLDVVVQKYFSNNAYIVVSEDSEIVPQNVLSNFDYHRFDPTSEYKLSSVLSSDITDAFVLMDNVEQKHVVYDILRKASRDMRIIVSVKNEAEEKLFNGDKTVLINEVDLISGAFSARLPNVPMIPQDFGLGKGEVMEINIPTGSVFAHRHIGSIQQKNYRIVGIYRQNEFLLSNYSMVIQPADTLLVAGNPQVLENVYRQIKNDIGQFPVPFGRDIYVYIDMLNQSRDAMIRDIDQALFLHKNLKNVELFIVVLHPNDFEVTNELKNLENTNINVVFDYRCSEFNERLEQDLKKRIGMVVVGRELFSVRKIRKKLFLSGIPVFKTCARNIDEMRKSIVVLNEHMSESENISPIIFDISIQMNLDILVYDFDPDSHYQEIVLEEYHNLSRLLDKKITIHKTHNKNPILFLRDKKEEAWLHFLPFERCITGRKFFNFLSTQVEKVSFMLDHHPQVFVPILENIDDR